MTAATAVRAPAKGPADTPIRTCARCATAYDWTRSRAVLRMTYCGILCEVADLGFSLEA